MQDRVPSFYVSFKVPCSHHGRVLYISGVESSDSTSTPHAHDTGTINISAQPLLKVTSPYSFFGIAPQVSVECSTVKQENNDKEDNPLGTLTNYVTNDHVLALEQMKRSHDSSIISRTHIVYNMQMNIISIHCMIARV